jgi:hypothetical protein
MSASCTARVFFPGIQKAAAMQPFAVHPADAGKNIGTARNGGVTNPPGKGYYQTK